MSGVDPKVVEKAARAILNSRRLRWADVHQGHCIVDARAVLDAVLPDLRAETDARVAAAEAKVAQGLRDDLQVADGKAHRAEERLAALLAGIEALHVEPYPEAGWCAGCYDGAREDTHPCGTLRALASTELGD